MLLRFCRVVDGINDYTGKIVSPLALVLVGILCWEVLLRTAFNAPTIWAHETSRYFFGAHFLLGGAYALKIGAMVKVDVLINRFKPRTQAIIDAATGILALFFISLLLWKGFGMTLHSISIAEKSVTHWGPVVYPLKMLIVVGALLMGIVLNFLSLRGVFGSYDDAVFGLILIVIMLFAPNGILSLNIRHRLKQFFNRAKKDKEGEA